MSIAYLVNPSQWLRWLWASLATLGTLALGVRPTLGICPLYATRKHMYTAPNDESNWLAAPLQHRTVPLQERRSDRARLKGKIASAGSLLTITAAFSAPSKSANGNQFFDVTYVHFHRPDTTCH